MAAVLAELDHAGTAADSLVVKYQDRDIQLGEAYRLFAENLLGVLDNRNSMANCFNVFALEF